jgi:hypothetical protein
VNPGHLQRVPRKHGANGLRVSLVAAACEP